MSLRILDPGLQSWIVDHGRPRTRHLGIPASGPADRESHALGNLLVGNSPDTAAIEFSLAGPTLQAMHDVGCAITGAPFEAAIGSRPIPLWKTFNFRQGQVLRIAGTKTGMRGYLCVAGGFQSPVILKSKTTLTPLARGQILDCSATNLMARTIASHHISSIVAQSPILLRTLPGPQSDWFQSEPFFSSEFQVTPASNRMGIRLLGPHLKRKTGELTSEPVAPGAVQVVNDGQCIILGVDGQTIGGYSKIAHVIAADLDILGQLRPGSTVRFQPCDLAEARNQLRIRDEHMREWIARLGLADHPGRPT